MQYTLSDRPLQIHWNNPEQSSNIVDTSGMRMYYTSNLRQHTAEMIFFGPVYMNIPQGQNSFSQQSRCPSECTAELFPETIYISKIFPHMHLLGKKHHDLSNDSLNGWLLFYFRC